MKFIVYYQKPLEERRPDLQVKAREVPETVKKEDYTKITELEAADLDVVFRQMNIVDGTELPIRLKCRSLSVGDIVEDSTGALAYCAPIGWVSIAWGSE